METKNKTEKVEYASLGIRKGPTLKRFKIYAIEKDREMRDILEAALREYMDKYK